MRRRAALAGHPLHPAVVAIPIGAFTLTLIADLLVIAGRTALGATASYALVVGIVGALLAAVLGFIDYFTVKMSVAGTEARPGCVEARERAASPNRRARPARPAELNMYRLNICRSCQG
ncbi:MAG TPA: DUF2231 domain-containing protein [Thermoanaerobaculia bacterium]|nr:DUF2231 domain-containing protein [Thermoanaerobaculia bacterium]